MSKKKDQKAPGKKATKLAKTKIAESTAKEPVEQEPVAEVFSSEVVYEGPLFKVVKEEVREPNGHTAKKDVIRHNGSIVILAVDASTSKKDPLIIMERQYRHAAGQFLWEIPAGKLEQGEERLVGAKRELTEETGYAAAQWTEMVRYYPSPGFLGEWMQIFLAEDLTPGEANLEADETLQVVPMSLSVVEALIDAGEILDGKTLIAIGHYKRVFELRKAKRKSHDKKKKK